MVSCPDCGKNGLERVSQHISLGSCEYVNPSQLAQETFKGLLMGDGCVAGSSGSRKSYFVIEMVENEFLEWLSGELGWLLYQPYQSKTGSESYQNTKRSTDRDLTEENFSATYRAQSPRHPWFDELRKWYSSGSKRFPDDLVLTSRMAKMWYVCDGSLREKEPNSQVTISSVNESHRTDYLIRLFEEQGLSPSYDGYSLVFSVEDSRDFFEWVGEPVPGFEYKWEAIEVGGFTPWRDRSTLEHLYIDKELSLAQVGERLGCSADTVSVWLRKHGLPVRDKAGRLPV